MKAWIINDHAQPPSQGGGTRHYTFARELNELGHGITLIASDTHYAYGTKVASRGGLECLDGVPFYWIPTPAYSGAGVKRVLSHLRFSLQLLKLRPTDSLPDPDVIVGSTPHFWQAWAAELLARRRKKPFVLEIRDFWPQSLIDFGGISESHPMIRWMRKVEPRLYRNASMTISLLSRAHEYLKGFGVPEDRFAWVPNGIDLSLLPERTPPPENDPFTITYSGAHGTANGLGALIEAMKLLESEPIKLRLIGNGPLKSKLVADAKGLKAIEFLDSVPKSQIFDLLSRSDAFTTLMVNADVFRWGISPNKVFDYLAVGRPIVFAGRVPDNPVELARSGLIVDFEPKAIAEGFRTMSRTDAAERQQMAARGRAYVEEHHDMRKLAITLIESLERAKDLYSRS